ncbi:MAG: MoxR family ATPase [Armatimonas sp.]
MDMTEAAARIRKMIDQAETVIVGKRGAIETAVVALLCNGHLLIEDIPGVGKTTLAKTLALSLGCVFRRIQFTPDLLPADITGTSIFNQKNQEFEFRPGPVFGNVVLADEINRATPKTQAALLECMEELQVTSDGVTHSLPRPFFVIATQNDLEHAGTYQLPEAQLDRFLMRLRLGYPALEDEVAILDLQLHSRPLDALTATLTLEELLSLQEIARSVHVDPRVQRYIVELVSETRKHPQIEVGASPRGSLGLIHAAQAYAAVQGRSFVLPDDVKKLASSVLAHRLVLTPESRARGVGDTEVVADLLNRIPVPVGIGK